MNVEHSDKIATGILYIISGIIVLILAALLLYISVRGTPRVSWSFLTESSKVHQEGGEIGIRLLSSTYSLLIAMIISSLVSLDAGTHLSEYARKSQLTDVIRMSIRILSSLPSIVVDLFGPLVFVTQLQYGLPVISDALALTVFNLSLLTKTVEKSLQAVHYTQRGAGLALGLSCWETVIKMVVPEATPEILTGVVLNSGRIFDEVAALIYTARQDASALDFTSQSSLSVSNPISVSCQVETLIVHIWEISAEGMMPDGVSASVGASTILIIAVLLFNFGARAIGKRLYRRMTSAQGEKAK